MRLINRRKVKAGGKDFTGFHAGGGADGQGKVTVAGILGKGELLIKILDGISRIRKDALPAAGIGGICPVSQKGNRFKVNWVGKGGAIRITEGIDERDASAGDDGILHRQRAAVHGGALLQRDGELVGNYNIMPEDGFPADRNL